MLSLYCIYNQWVGYAPTVVEELNPMRLPIEREPELKFKAIQSLGSGGLYTAEDIKKTQDAIIFGLERKVINIIARKVAGHKVNP